MGAGALRALAASLLVGVAAASGLGLMAAAPLAAALEADPFAAMNALPVRPPAAAPEVRFEGLDGRPATLKAFRGRPVLLTFFTTW